MAGWTVIKHSIVFGDCNSDPLNLLHSQGDSCVFIYQASNLSCYKGDSYFLTELVKQKNALE